MVTIAVASTANADDRSPLEHGLALAERSGAMLLSVHANDDASSVERMLNPAEILRGWGRDPAALRHEELVHECCDDPVDTVLDALRKRRPDLVVAATHQRKGVVRVFFESRAEAIAENVRVPTLLVPLEGDGFVGARGELDLRRLLVPVGDAEAAREAIDAAIWLIELARVENVVIELLHVGEPGTEPELALPNHPRVRFTQRTVQGLLEDMIADAAQDARAVVMATRGHDSMTDAIVGSRTERVLRRIRCPLLSVPMTP